MSETKTTQEQPLNALMVKLKDAQRTYLKALGSRDDVVSDIMGHGFSRDAVLFALQTVEANPQDEFAKMVQAKELIEAAPGGATVEFVSKVETPYRKDHEMQVKAYQAGRDAAKGGERCQSPYEPGILHRKWVAGWRDSKKG